MIATTSPTTIQHRQWFCVFAMAALTTVVAATHAIAQEIDGTDRPAVQDAATTELDRLRSARERQPWKEAPPEERQVVEQMLASPDWAFRTLALMRLDRFDGDAVHTYLNARLADEAWQVRCFAIRHAWMHGYEISPVTFAEEADARVIRTLLRHGVEIDEKKLNDLTVRLLRMRTVDAVLMGIELAASCKSDGVRKNASRRTVNLITNMSPQVAAVIGRRLAATLKLSPSPQNVQQWRQWLSRLPRTWQLPTPDPPLHALRTASLIAEAEAEKFARLRDYMGVLRQRDLELVIALDATTSMMPVIDEVKADIDALILFLSDLSSTMRLGICAYRDYDNVGRLIEAHPFSTDLESLRNFLFGLQALGGATYPEAVLSGLDACRKFEWSMQSERQIILIGDAPPHQRELSDLRRLLAHYVDNGFTIHAVHVPDMRQGVGSEYNVATRQTFSEIAKFGGGKLVELDSAGQNDLVRHVMRLTLEKEWWPYFDEFYDSYMDLCR